jgi:hypothetical protein
MIFLYIAVGWLAVSFGTAAVYAWCRRRFSGPRR